jgi:hypothetical protein
VRSLLFVLLLASLVTMPAHAQAESPGAKSEAAALRWSLGGTVIPVVLGIAATAVMASGESQGGEVGGLYPAIAGVIVGPALGHFYAGRPGRAGMGILLRAGVMAAATGAAVAICIEDCTSGQETGALAVFVMGATVAALSAVADIAAAPRSARRYNETHLSVTPVIDPRRGVGFVVVLSY